MDAWGNQLKNIPFGNEYHANRYDDDNDMKLHIWDDNGKSFDIIKSKLDEVLYEHYLGGEGVIHRHYDKLLDGMGKEIKKAILNRMSYEYDFRIVVLMVPKRQSPQKHVPDE